MSKIKTLRAKSGFTQMELAEKTGLSIRTIQRFETGATEPKGHSLRVLAKALNVDLSVLQNQDLDDVKKIHDSDKLSIMLINLSTLAFMIFPFGNLIVPFMIWSKRRESIVVDTVGRKIINFQIIWSMILCLLLCVSPFIDMSGIIDAPLIFVVLFIAFAINLLTICTTAFLIQRDKMNFLNLPIRFL